ncbi:MAG: hotdog domain-containing protein [Acidimicrobiia bacterium]
MPLEAGLSARCSLTVTTVDLAPQWKTGDVAVLATARLVALAEEATVAAIAGQLELGATSVGHRIQIDHLAPAVLGQTIDADALLEAVEGRRLIFRVSISDSHGLLAAGRVTRVIVERERFLEKARQ